MTPKVRRVATPEGAAHFGVPIKTPIKAAEAAKKARQSKGNSTKPTTGVDSEAVKQGRLKRARPSYPSNKADAVNEIRGLHADLLNDVEAYKKGTPGAPARRFIDRQIASLKDRIEVGDQRGWGEDIRKAAPSVPELPSEAPAASPPKKTARKKAPAAGQTRAKVTPTPKADAFEQSIRDAYTQLRLKPGGAVWLSDVRRKAIMSPAKFDEVIRRLSRMDGVEVIPEENRKAIPDHARAGAVTIGGQPAHHIRFR